MDVPNKENLMKKLEGIGQMPTLPVSLLPVLRYMEQPVDKLQVKQVVEFISQDKSLAAQSLHLANSPLYGRWQKVDTVRDAVVSLGLQRMRDIVVSCSVLTLMPKEHTGVDPVVFWEHSFGVALVCRQLARCIGFADPGKAYLAGLLHDIGIVAHLWMLPHEFALALKLACERRAPLHEAEAETLGTTHAETGKVVAEHWHLPADIVEVAGFHHSPDRASTARSLVALVSLADLLCRMSGLGHGPIEERVVDFPEQPGFGILKQECSSLQDFDWARFTFELDAYMEEVRRIVGLLYRPQ